MLVSQRGRRLRAEDWLGGVSDGLFLCDGLDIRGAESALPAVQATRLVRLPAFQPRSSGYRCAEIRDIDAVFPGNPNYVNRA